MGKYKIICLTFILILFVTVGCIKNPNTNSTTSNNNNEEKNNESNESIIPPIKQEEETTLTNKVTTEDYKKLLITNYEKYIKPLNLEEYDDLKLAVSDKGPIDNDSLLNEYKEYINDNRSNLRSFEQSMTNIDIEESKTYDLNKQLVKECKIYIKDLDKIESYLDVIDQNTLEKSNEEFIRYLEEIIDSDDIEQSKLEEVIIESQNTLGITLKEVESIQ